MGWQHGEEGQGKTGEAAALGADSTTHQPAGMDFAAPSSPGRGMVRRSTLVQSGRPGDGAVSRTLQPWRSKRGSRRAPNYRDDPSRGMAHGDHFGADGLSPVHR